MLPASVLIFSSQGQALCPQNYYNVLHYSLHKPLHILIHLMTRAHIGGARILRWQLTFASYKLQQAVWAASKSVIIGANVDPSSFQPTA